MDKGAVQGLHYSVLFFSLLQFFGARDRQPEMESRLPALTLELLLRQGNQSGSK